MATKKSTLRTCKQGHSYYKTSDCPTCPVCERNKKPAEGFLATLASPARNALLHNKIDTVQKLAEFTRAEILKLHGIGPASLPALLKALSDAGLTFK
jgi:DNA-directed RNA polymerase alpha subunit